MKADKEANSLEYNLKEDDQLCFIHIPKTAGTTFISIIDSKFNVAEISPELTYLQEMISEGQTDARTLTPELMKKYKLIRGHFNYYDVDKFLVKKPLYMTMLRNPIDRTISLYEFFKRAKEREEPEYNKDTKVLREATSAGLRSFVCDPNPIVKARILNFQVRQLASQDTLNLSNELSDVELLALAKKHLEEFIFFGLTEKFQHSLFLLLYIFGWCPIASYQDLRVATKKSCLDELTPGTIDLIASCNRLDIELYQYAEQLFDARYSQMLNELQQKSDRWSLTGLRPSAAHRQPKEILQLLEKHYEQRQSELKIPRVQTIDFNFLQPISGSGWHRRNGRFNGLKNNVTTFRWTGPDTVSTLDFPLAADIDLVIKLRIINAATADILKSLTLKVNDSPIALKTLKRNGNLAILRGVIPQTALSHDQTMSRLTFEVDRTVSLHSIDSNNPDKRLVGVALQQIQIFPITAQPRDDDYMCFPQEDPIWCEVADFLDRHLQLLEQVVAPDEFYERYPQQFSSDTQPFISVQPVWVVIHKGQIQGLDAASLQWVTQHLTPVFANVVFVVFTTRSDLEKLSDRSTHLQAFWATQPLPLPIRLWKKIKARITRV